jgi:tetratricopeptide (TPR) repeat protein
LNLGWQLFQAGQSLPAEIEFDNLLEFDPDFWGGHWGKGHIYLQRDMHADAIAEFSRAVELGGGHTLPLASLGYAHALAGQRDEAFAVIKQLHEIAENIYVSPVDVATVYAGLNEREDVFEWLQKAYEVRARSIAWLSVRKEFAAVRDDPRFIALIASVGTTPGQSD